MKHVVVIGGGTGTFVVLNALKNFDLHLYAVVSMADDGGSTGLLRDQYGVLPPGDVRRALVALSDSSDTLRELFNYRFEGGGLHGHSFGNLFLSGLEKVTGSFSKALEEAARILNTNGEVVPVTFDNVRLSARLADGHILRGETNIDRPKGANRAKIEEVWLEPEARMNPSLKRVFKNADMIILGPGDLYTSVIPNLLVAGLPEAIRSSKAKKVYIGNLMTKMGETDMFRAEDFISEIEKYLGKGVLDAALWNKHKPTALTLRRYKKEGAEFIAPPAPPKKKKPQYVFADLLDRGRLVRHNSDRLGQAIFRLL